MADFVINEEVMDVIQQVYDATVRTRQNIPSRPTSERQFNENEDHQAPETYIAIPVDDEGINGLNHAIENVSGEDDELGYGECDIFQLVDGKLSWVEKSEMVYNLSEERIRNGAFSVTRDKFGNWLVVNKTVLLEGILTKRLEPATGPLTGATFGYLRLIEFKERNGIGTGTGTGTGSGSEDATPDTWQVTNRILRFVNRSVNFKGAAGTFGSVKSTGGEFRPDALDCKASEEGVQAIVDYWSDTFGGFVFGG